MNAVALGVIKTPMHPVETHAQLGALHPMGRMAKAHQLPRTEGRDHRSWIKRVQTESMDDDSVITPPLLNPLGAELVVSAVPAGRQFALD